MSTIFEAAIFEEDFSAIDQLLEEATQEGIVRPQLDDLTIRKMVIRRKILLREVEKTKALRDAVKAEWDKKVKKTEDQVSQLEGVIYGYVENKGTLSLDVATVSTRANKHKVEVADADAFVTYLKNQNLYENFLGAKPFNELLARAHFIEMVDQTIDSIQQAGKDMIKAKEDDLKARLKDLKSDEKKAEQARLAAEKKELLAGTKLAIEGVIESFKSNLPEALSYKPESKSLSIRWNNA